MFEDPLIDWNLRNLSIIFNVIFLLTSLFIIGFICRKSRPVLWLTIVAAILILFLLIVTRNKYGLGFFSFKF